MKESIGEVLICKERMATYPQRGRLPEYDYMRIVREVYQYEKYYDKEYTDFLKLTIEFWEYGAKPYPKCYFIRLYADSFEWLLNELNTHYSFLLDADIIRYSCYWQHNLWKDQFLKKEIFRTWADSENIKKVQITLRQQLEEALEDAELKPRMKQSDKLLFDKFHDEYWAKLKKLQEVIPIPDLPF